MGMSTRSGGGGKSRRHRRGGHAPMSEINVTPFVDVMMVLLVIFMVAAPLLVSGILVELPEVQARALGSDKDFVTVSIDRDGKVYLGENDTEIAVPDLIAKLNANIKKESGTPILLRGDKDTKYGRVAFVFGAINAAGFRKVRLITQPEVVEVRN